MPEWKHLRYASIQGNGMLLSQPGQLYFAHLAAFTAAQRAVLYDHTMFPQAAFAVLAAPAYEQAPPYPPVPGVTISLLRGVYVSYSNTLFTGLVVVGWERQ